MSSPRPPASELRLDPQTFGDTPAALYLVEILRQRQDKNLARSVARTLNQARTLLADLARAHLDYDALSTRSLAQLLTLLSAHNRHGAVEALRQKDPFVANLVVNVLEGQVKTWKQRVTRARQQEKQLARDNNGPQRDAWIPAQPVLGEKSAVLLQQRSKSALRRRGKRDTLY